MAYPSNLSVTAFDASRRIAAGALIDVISDVQRYLVRVPEANIAAFDDMTGERIELDWNVSQFHLVAQLAPPIAAAPARLEPSPGPRGPGRPRLGVVAREVTLLPAHWEWLNGQPGGASATLRKLVEDGQRMQETRERARSSQEAAYRFMLAMAPELPGYDEALRALHGADALQFDASTANWPDDLRAYVRTLAFPPT